MLKPVTFGQSLGDVSPQSLYITGDEYRCYAPVYIQGSRDGSNNLTLTWIRRDRKFEGLNFSDTEPLSESSEAYSVDILSNSPKTITGITNAAQAVITSASHGLSVGQSVLITGVKGMTQINNMVATITATTTNTLTVNLVTTEMDAYVSGGTAERILRTISATTPTTSYSAANQTSDGYTPGNPVKLGVSQIGRWGRGYVRVVTV